MSRPSRTMLEALLRWVESEMRVAGPERRKTKWWKSREKEVAELKRQLAELGPAEEPSEPAAADG